MKRWTLSRRGLVSGCPRKNCKVPPVIAIAATMNRHTWTTRWDIGIVVLLERCGVRRGLHGEPRSDPCAAPVRPQLRESPPFAIGDRAHVETLHLALEPRSRRRPQALVRIAPSGGTGLAQGRHGADRAVRDLADRPHSRRAAGDRGR